MGSPKKKGLFTKLASWTADSLGGNFPVALSFGDDGMSSSIVLIDYLNPYSMSVPIYSTSLCPTSSDRNRSEPLGTARIPSRHLISTQNLISSEQFQSDPSRFQVEFRCLLRIRAVLSGYDWNLRFELIFLKKNSFILYFTT